MSGSSFFSRRDVVRDVRTFVVAAVACSVVMVTPTVAAEIVNADTVDGKHAGGPGAPTAQRAGKLVATNANGFLPNNIVVKAQDADKLDGKDQNDFSLRTAAPGSVQTGAYSMFGGGGDFVSDFVPFRSRLPVRLPESRVQFIREGAAGTPECPGPGQVVPSGWLCVYERQANSITFLNSFIPETTFGGVSVHGFAIVSECVGSNCHSFGSWAVKASSASGGSAADVGPRAGGRAPRGGVPPMR